MTFISITSSTKESHNSVNAPSRELDPINRKTQSIADRLFPGHLKWDLAKNAARDFVWASWSAFNGNFTARMMPSLNPSDPIASQITSQAFVQPMGAQWVYGTIPMMAIAAYETVKLYQERKNEGKELCRADFVKIWAPVAAGSLAIPMWDLGQVIGSHLGTMISASSLAAGMMAAPFTGILEGFTQWGVRYAADLAINPIRRKMWHLKPSLMAKVFVKELILNITIGAIPGAMWQIVYFLLLPVLLGLLGSTPAGWAILAFIATALAVAATVMLCNFLCNHLINRCSTAIDQSMGWKLELKELELSLQQPQADSANQERNIVESCG